MLKRKLDIKEFFFFVSHIPLQFFTIKAPFSLFLFTLHKTIISKKRTDFLYNFSGVPVSFAKAGGIRYNLREEFVFTVKYFIIMKKGSFSTGNIFKRHFSIYKIDFFFFILFFFFFSHDQMTCV